MHRAPNAWTGMVDLPCARCPMPDHPPCQIIPHPLAQTSDCPDGCAADLRFGQPPVHVHGIAQPAPVGQYRTGAAARGPATCLHNMTYTWHLTGWLGTKLISRLNDCVGGPEVPLRFPRRILPEVKGCVIVAKPQSLKGSDCTTARNSIWFSWSQTKTQYRPLSLEQVQIILLWLSLLLLFAPVGGVFSHGICSR